MDTYSAKALLTQIRGHKQASMASVLRTGYGWVDKQWQDLLQATGTSAPPTAQHAAILAKANDKLQTDAQADIVKVVLQAAGIGAATRGGYALWDAATATPEVADARSVELPIFVPKKRKKVADTEVTSKLPLIYDPKDAEVTSKSSLSYYLSGMLLGAPLAVYGGWKGMDLLMEAQRKREIAEDVKKSKGDYEQALLGMYKRSTDLALARAFQGYKQAMSANPLKWPGELLSAVSPDAGGLLGSAANTYTLAALPAGYILVHNKLKKLNKQKLLVDAMEIHAMNRDRQQPLPLYAVPEERPNN